jgi:metal transporter CNNM
VLWPLDWTTGRLLDAWVGPEGVPRFAERRLRQVLRQHARDASSEIGQVEAVGAISFLALDDLAVGEEGEPLDAASVIRLPFRDGQPVFPALTRRPQDPFLARPAACRERARLPARRALRVRAVRPARPLPSPARRARPAPAARPGAHPPARAARAPRRRRRRRGADPGVDGRQPPHITGSGLLGRLLRGIARPVVGADGME